MHANFSTNFMRETGGKDYFEALMAAFEKNLMDHIAVYGPDNDKRLTGKHETASLEQVQLWRCRPWRVDPRAALLRQQRTTRAISKTVARTRKATPTNRFADPEDDRRSSDRRQGGGGLSDRLYDRPGWGRPGCNLIRQGKIALADHCVLMTLI